MDGSPQNWTTDQLAQLISSLPGWSSESKYNSNDWKRMTEVAFIFQSAETQKVAEAFQLFTVRNTNDFHGDYLESSKPFILLRVMFDLPEHAKVRPGGPGWLTLRRDLNRDGSVNVGWPIIWSGQGGKPSLASEYLGYEGSPYDPKADYIFLSGHFKKRDLSGFLTRQTVNLNGS